MQYSKLSDMINYLQYGTKLHIGVLFFGNYGNEMVKLPHRQEIHASALCDYFKMQNFERCFRCRNAAIYKAIKSKKDFGGICVNGIYEYTRPVIINGEVASIIFIGNILDEEKGYTRIRRCMGETKSFSDTLEHDFSQAQCKELGALIESYIRFLLENFSDKADNDPVIENIKNYIEENLEFNIKISHVARIFHYNEQYFGRFFKRKTGKSFSEYVNFRRLEKTKLLLRDTEHSVLDISCKAGFNNVTYFNRLFKQSFGVTPSEYRKK